MNANELRKKFLEYFENRGHKVIPSASLVPENDPTALFTSAGMQPLVPYLMGETHPMGKKLADVQKCIRTDDIDEVGDKVHHTFFEMLGNWSLGDYFKKEAIEMSFEFLTNAKWLGLDRKKLAVSIFEGDKDAPFDQESYDKWIELGISTDRIAKLPKKNNWWGPGESGPSGPDTEMFYWTGSEPTPDKFDDKNANWVEIWNDVFMQYFLKEGKYTPLAQKNVDTGMGLERMLAVMNGVDDNYKTDLFSPILDKISELSGKSYEGNEREFRIIADHIKAAIFAISDGVSPSNKGAGYVVRRLIRRAIVKGQQLGIKNDFASKLAEVVFKIYDDAYFYADKNSIQTKIKEELEKEESKFRKTLGEGLKIINERRDISGKILFDLYQSFGIPLEISVEELKRRDIEVDEDIREQYSNMLEEHRNLSRTASAGMFKGGLADAGEVAVKYHTATHLLMASLRQVLGGDVHQRGSNINSERLRLDFSYPEKLEEDQVKKVEDLVNANIQADLPVFMEEMNIEDARKCGAVGEFGEKYGYKVKVYTMGKFSKEICGGPHVSHTGELGHFKIIKEESSSSGIRRIKAVLQ